MTGYESNIVLPTVVIAAGEALSGGIQLGGLRLCGIILPSGWDAAGITFQGSADGTTYANLYDKTAEVFVAPITGAAFVALDPATFAAVPYVKIRSGTSASAVNQVDSVTLTLVLRSV